MSANCIDVTSADDPRLADYRAVRDRDQRHAGTFLVEGEVPLRAWLAAGRFPARSVLVSDRRIGAIGEALPNSLTVFVAPQAVMEAVAGFPIHRGVLGCGERIAEPAPASVLSAARLVLVLEGLTNHDNVGGCFRNAAAFGADAVVVDGRTADPLYRKAIRVSAGAALTVPWARGGDGPGLVAACAAAGLRTCALTPDRGASPLTEVLAPGPIAFVLGTEGPGLSRRALAAADLRARIPMAPGFDSLNVATAAAVALAFATAPASGGPRR